MDKEEQRKHFNQRMKYLILMVLVVALLHLVVIVLLHFGVDVYIPNRYQWLREFSAQ